MAIDPEQHPNPEVRRKFAELPPEAQRFVRLALGLVDKHGWERFDALVNHADALDAADATARTIAPGTRGN